ncbi:MAG: succinylglutamate desuccinylase/aspartoacylase family protein [Oligoflexales bacterium]|nr:succinylglutamate desuccinylase/aspartoacylase family protein [Oligoflexales bacterium]
MLIFRDRSYASFACQDTSLALSRQRLIKKSFLVLGIFIVWFFQLSILPSSSVQAAIVSENNDLSKENAQKLGRYCDTLNSRFKSFGWSRIVCNPKTWTMDENYVTPKGNPLIFQTFKGENPKTRTIVFCGVHGDEHPSIYQCIHLVREIIFDNPSAFNESLVVVAPLVNPDGFLAGTPTRPNAKGVDLNRNFPTKDFNEEAIKEWKGKYKSDKRKYPGTEGGSEIETKFQMMLIEKFKPDKIVSIHSPLGFLDVDSPTRTRTISGDESDGYEFAEFVKKAHDVALVMSKNSNNFRLMKFHVYPGSLGNYAAKERGIPTYTLELENSDPHKGQQFWNRIRKGIISAIQYQINVR